MGQTHDFPFGIMDVVELLHLRIRRPSPQAKLTEDSRIALVAVWLYALIATTSEAYFTNGTGVQMALFLSIFIGYGLGTGPDARKTIAD